MIDRATAMARRQAESVAENELAAMKAAEHWLDNCIVFDVGGLGLLVYSLQVTSGRHEPRWVTHGEVRQIRLGEEANRGTV